MRCITEVAGPPRATHVRGGLPAMQLFCSHGKLKHPHHTRQTLSRVEHDTSHLCNSISIKRVKWSRGAVALMPQGRTLGFIFRIYRFNVFQRRMAGGEGHFPTSPQTMTYDSVSLARFPLAAAAAPVDDWA